MSSGIDFGANCNLKNLKTSTQLFPGKGPYTQSLQTIQEEFKVMYIHHDGQMVIKDYRNYGTKTPASNCAYTCRDIYQQCMHSQI